MAITMFSHLVFSTENPQAKGRGVE